ncbi:TLDc domain-containing protein [Entamoeba marina]
MSESFNDLMKQAKQMNNILQGYEKEVYTIEVEHVQQILEKYGVILQDNTCEVDKITKYEVFYKELVEYILIKISEIDYMAKNLNGPSSNGRFLKVVNKKKDNVNDVIDCVNKIVERIRKLETDIYNDRMKTLNNMEVQKYVEGKTPRVINLNRQLTPQKPQKLPPKPEENGQQHLIQTGLPQPINVNGNEMDIINNSMNLLKQWSNKNNSEVIFDSNVDGDGSNNVLHGRVFNKSNMYFITSDGNNNLFGGYVNAKIDKSNVQKFIYDGNSYIFSLIRNKKVNNKRYFIRLSKNDKAFKLSYNDKNGWLYQFGGDINIYKVGSDKSICNNGNNSSYKYKTDYKPLIDAKPDEKFKVQRIIVIQMN